MEVFYYASYVLLRPILASEKVRNWKARKQPQNIRKNRNLQFLKTKNRPKNIARQLHPAEYLSEFWTKRHFEVFQYTERDTTCQVNRLSAKHNSKKSFLKVI